MANRFWVGGTATWNSTAASKWATTSGGAGGAAVPTAADDVFFDGASGAVTISITSAGGNQVCRSLNCTGFTGTFSLDTSGLSIGDASGGALKLVAGMTLTLANSPTFSFVSTSNNSGTGWAITTGGKTLPSSTFNGAGGKWVLQDSFTATGATITLTAGTLDTNSQTCTWGVFSSNNSNTRSLTLGTSTVSCTATGIPWSMATTSGLTLSAASSTITLSGAGASFSSGSAAGSGQAYGTINMTGSGLAIMSGAASGTNSCTNLNRTGTAAKTDQFQLNGNWTVTGTLTLAGNTTQGVNRMLVQSNTVGTQRSFVCTGAAVVISGDVDFVDVAITGSPSWANSGNAYIGDCGGNGTLITTNKTTATTLYWVGGNNSGNWSDTTKWSTSSGGASGARVPLPQDSVRFDANSVTTTSRTIVYDMPRLGGDIDYNGVLNSPTLQYNVGATSFGSYTLVSGLGQSGSTGLTFAGRGTHTFTSAGYSFPQGLTFAGPGGTYTLQDALTTVGTLTISDGTFTTNNNAVTCTTFNAASSRTLVVNLGTSTVTLTTTSTVICWQTNSTNNTINGGSSTVVISAASSNTRTMSARNSTTFGTITYTVANSPGILALSAPSGFNFNLSTLNIGSGRSLQLNNTATAYNLSTFNVNGVANGYLYLPGLTANGSTTLYASAPHINAYDITSAVDMRARVALDDWTPAINQRIFGNTNNNVGGNASGGYGLLNYAAGWLGVYWVTNANAQVFVQSSVAHNFVDGSLHWVRATITPDNGSGSYAVSFYHSSDNTNDPSAVNWTLINTITGAASTIGVNNTSPMCVGTIGDLTNGMSGKIYRVELRNGINGTVVFDTDFTNRNVSSNNWLNSAKTQFAESSSNANTVTLNGGAATGDGRVILDATTAGTRATLSKTSGIVSCNYLSIKDSAADGGASWHALSSADAGNNTGWIFGSTPSTSTNFLIFGGPQ